MPGATRDGRPDHLEESLVDARDGVRGDREQVGIRGAGQVVLDHHPITQARRDHAGIGRGDREIESRTATVGTVDAEHLAHDPELEGGHSGDGQQDDALEHGTIVSVLR